MRLFFALIGALFGCFFVKGGSPAFHLVLSLAFLFAFSLAWISKRRRLFILFFAFGISIPLLYSLLPVSSGPFRGAVIKTGENYLILSGISARYYVYSPSHPYQVGDFLSIEGYGRPLRMTAYESRFDFGAYLSNYGVKAEISGAEITEVFLFPLRIKKRRDEVFSALSPAAYSAVSAIFFNHKDYDSPLIQNADELNLLFVLSSSGFLYGGAVRLLSKPGFAISKKAGRIGEIAIASALLLFSIGKIGAIRVYLCLLLKNHKRFPDYLSRLSFVGLLLLAIDFHFAYQSGYLLGFLIAFLFCFSRQYLSAFSSSRRKWAGKLLLFALVIPSGIYFATGGFRLLSPLYASIVSPLVLVIYLLSLFSFFFFPLRSAIELTSSGLEYLLTSLNQMNPSIDLPPIEAEGILLYYLTVIVCLMLLEFGLRYKAELVGGLFMVIYLLSLFPISGYVFSSIAFINVGQGDSILLIHHGKALLIDTGGSLSFDMAEEVLLPYFRRRRVYSLEALCLTHADFDHSGAKDSLLEGCKVKQVLDSPADFPFYLDDLRIENLNDYGLAGENESSLVLSFSLGGDAYLLMGDATEEVERRIIADYPDLEADILKVGHHGSDTSSSKEFLLSLRPKVAVISVGAGNSYGHPDEKVISRLSSIGAEIRRTDEEGTIVFSYFAV